MIRRRSSASSSFVLAATRLRALQQDPLPHGDVTGAAARKIPKNSQAQPGDIVQVTGLKPHALLTPMALMGGPHGCRVEVRRVGREHAGT